MGNCGVLDEVVIEERESLLNYGIGNVGERWDGRTWVKRKVNVLLRFDYGTYSVDTKGRRISCVHLGW